MLNKLEGTASDDTNVSFVVVKAWYPVPAEYIPPKTVIAQCSECPASTTGTLVHWSVSAAALGVIPGLTYQVWAYAYDKWGNVTNPHAQANYIILY
jgi:hypothetical protein